MAEKVRKSSATLYRDPDSFQKPLDAEMAVCTKVLGTPVRKIAGSEAALHAAMRDFKSLEAFNKSVETHLENATFNDLPVVRNWGRRMAGLHQLHCGPFRGVFLVGEKSKVVAALLFSRKPHDVSKRLHELVADYRAKVDEKPGEDS